MKTVHRLLDKKGREIYAIGPDATVYDALGLMGAKGRSDFLSLPW